MNIIKESWKALGFDDTMDFVATVIGNKSMASLYLQSGVALLAAFASFAREYMFDPPMGILVIILLVFMDSILGARVSMKAGNSFSLVKFSRLIIVAWAYIFILVLSHLMAKVEPVMLFFMPSSVFFFFSTRTFLSILRNCAILGLISGTLVDLIAKKLGDQAVILFSEAAKNYHNKSGNTDETKNLDNGSYIDNGLPLDKKHPEREQ